MPYYNRPIIALLTDFGLNDNYVAIMKGVIKNICPSCDIIDITHNISPQDIISAGYLLKNSYEFFPKKTIFVCVVDPGVGTNRKIIISSYKNNYFIAPDNGLLNIIFEDLVPKNTIYANNSRYFLNQISATFHGRDIFAPISAYIAKGINFEDLGEKTNTIHKISIPKIKKEGKNTIIGNIIHFDNFGNIITNITKKNLKKSFKIKIKGKIITKLSNSYAENKKGALIAIIGSTNFLEISKVLGNAKNYLKIDKYEKVFLTVD